MVRTIFAQPDPESVWAQHRRVVNQLADAGFEVAADHLDQPAGRSSPSPGNPKRTGARSGRTTPKNG
jgi:hypothetical protein